MLVRRLVVTLLPLLPLVAARPAAADRVLVSCRVVGEVSDAVRANVCSKVQGGVVAAGHEVVADDLVAGVLKQSPSLANCGTPTCLRAIAQQCQATAALSASIEILNGTPYHYKLEVFGSDDSTGAPTDDTCNACRLEEAYDEISKAAKQVTAHLSVRPPPAKPRAPMSPLLFQLGVASAVVGGVAIVTSVILLALNGSFVSYGVDTTTTPNRGVKRTLDTVPAVGLLVVGAALVSTAGVLGWKHRQRRRAYELAPTALLAPDARGGLTASAGLAGRF